MNNIEEMIEQIGMKYEHYTTLHEAYLKDMQNSGGYEINPDYEFKPGELMTPAAVIEGIASGEMTDKGIKRAKESGKIREITAIKPDALIAIESEIQGACIDVKAHIDSLLSKYQVTKSRGKNTGDGTYKAVPDTYVEPLKQAVLTKYPDAVFTLEGRQLTGTTDKGQLFSFNVYGQNKFGINNIRAWVQAH